MLNWAPKGFRHKLWDAARRILGEICLELWRARWFERVAREARPRPERPQDGMDRAYSDLVGKQEFTSRMTVNALPARAHVPLSLGSRPCKVALF